MESVLELFAPQCDMRLNNATGNGFAGVGMFPTNGHRAEPKDIWKARRFIEEHAGEHLSLRKVAAIAEINATHLSEKFKQVTGVKFVDYVARIRFERARKFLEDPGLRVSEIAFAVGFQSLSQFNRVFKKFSGQSPSEYRGVIPKRRVSR